VVFIFRNIKSKIQPKGGGGAVVECSIDHKICYVTHPTESYVAVLIQYLKNLLFSVPCIELGQSDLFIFPKIV
jgi:hypothetical protein